MHDISKHIHKNYLNVFGNFFGANIITAYTYISH